MDQLNHVKFFTKVDLHVAYNMVCIQESDEWKIFFKPVIFILNILWCFLTLPMHMTCYFSTFDEQCFPWIFRWFYGLLHQWHPHVMTTPFFIHVYPFKPFMLFKQMIWLFIRCHTFTTWHWFYFSCQNKLCDLQ